jgi:hypothetical protein
MEGRASAGSLQNVGAHVLLNAYYPPRVCAPGQMLGRPQGHRATLKYVSVARTASSHPTSVGTFREKEAAQT